MNTAKEKKNKFKINRCEMNLMGKLQLFKSALSEERFHIVQNNRVFYKYIITVARFKKSPSENISN